MQTWSCACVSFQQIWDRVLSELKQNGSLLIGSNSYTRQEDARNKEDRSVAILFQMKQDSLQRWNRPTNPRLPSPENLGHRIPCQGRRYYVSYNHTLEHLELIKSSFKNIYLCSLKIIFFIDAGSAFRTHLLEGIRTKCETREGVHTEKVMISYHKQCLLLKQLLLKDF